MTTYLLRDVDEDFWAAVKVRAAKDRLPIRTVILALLKLYASGKLRVSG